APTSPSRYGEQPGAKLRHHQAATANSQEQSSDIVAAREGPQAPPAARYYGEHRSGRAKRSGGLRGVVPPG
ncbi:MAG: hypothetical protein ACRDOL_17700, partial [Streptosporangiaceae bacterium]